ncbi:cytidine deaminase [Bacillus sp. FJAT-42376]|uniref:cytidine deaminase n=1 Tax=Bacillus sp. FJAT-42376 TaxID=2014076 RepID=UPI000F50DE7F|nr:cytidine deaminase [Bacillus sp. FJAT-42376]AZB41457.1 cytidine deaminase [Bacillus sp. FJAT-42376]
MHTEISLQDEELIKAAKEIIIRHYEYGKHHVGAALRTAEGDIITAVHIEAYIGRVTVCAEAIAIGKAISEGHRTFDSIVAVRHPGPDEADREIRVVAPCGMCRELIGDYGENMKVILDTEDGLSKRSIQDLLPLKYTRPTET